MVQNILIVDDEEDIRGLIRGILEDEGYEISEAGTSEAAYAVLEKSSPDLIILDIWLRGSEHDGMEILSFIREHYQAIPVLMISGHGTIETAVSALRHGAYDFIEKPFKSDRLLLTIQRALENAQLRTENEILKKEIHQTPVMDIIGSSPAIQSLKQILEKVGAANSRALITGEAGTGKEMAARMIHACSERRDKLFYVLNCATLHPERFEAELFGTLNPDGSMTPGIMERADGSTLLLDEVADMPMETQDKIVRVLQEQRIERIGTQTPIDVDVRILASTNKDLVSAMSEGKFREDLFYRLNVVPVSVPPLRERLSDIPDLCDYFIAQHVETSGLPAKQFSEAAYTALKRYNWPGNVRQLRNVIEWVLIMSDVGDEEPLPVSALPPEVTGEAESVPASFQSSLMELPLREAREAFERDYLLTQVQRFDGNVSKTAEFIGMERSALHRKLKSLEISSMPAQDSAVRTDPDLRKRA